jgi:hypothetical protein
MSFESFYKFFNKGESQETENKKPADKGHPETARLPENHGKKKRQDHEQFLANLEATMARIKEKEAREKIAAAEARDPSNLLRRAAIARLPQIEHILARPLHEKTEEEYQKDHITVPKGDLSFWHFYDLEEGIPFLANCKDYLPEEEYRKSVAKLRDAADAVKRILHEYGSVWAPRHEHPADTKMCLFMLLGDLRRLAPEDFGRDLVTLTDEEFKGIGGLGGLAGRFLYRDRDGRNAERQLWMRAKLAEYDPERFRRIFGSEYDPGGSALDRSYWEAWDREHPMAVPKCLPAWETIARTIHETQAPMK